MNLLRVHVLHIPSVCTYGSNEHNGRGHNKNSLPSESFENTVLDVSQYGESNGGDRFSIGRSMAKLCVKINQILVQRAREDYFPPMRN